MRKSQILSSYFKSLSWKIREGNAQSRCRKKRTLIFSQLTSRMRPLSFALTHLLFCVYSFQFQLFSQSFLFLLRRNLLTALLAHPEMFRSLIAGRHGAESQLHDIHLKLVHIYSLSVSSNKSNFILFNVFIVL